MSAKTHFLFRSEKKIRERQRIAEGSGRRSDTMDQGMSGFCIKTSRGSRGNGGTKCGRWNPTEEQVKVLTDLFGSGLRTPSTDQIQNISSQLSFYGEIESKNVFYWFQNHKARERVKRRRTSVEKNPDLDEIKEKSSRARHYVEESETGMETLQLFPLNSYEECESEKMMRFFKNECEMMREMEYPPLDLRLSFF